MNARDIMKMRCVKIIVALVRSAKSVIQGTVNTFRDNITCKFGEGCLYIHKDDSTKKKNLWDQGRALKTLKDFKYQNHSFQRYHKISD